MDDLIHYTQCPACGSTTLTGVFKVKDYTVSGEMFEVMECKTCTLRFTQDVPGPASIGRYYQSEDYISHSNTTKGFLNRLYQTVRKRTIRKKRKLVERFSGKSQGDLLDVGSGTGSFAHEMKQKGWTVTGLEPDEGAREVGSRLYGLQLLEPKQLFTFNPGSFDVITLWHVLEHVHDLQGYIHQFKQLLKGDGTLVIAVPNYTSLDASIYREYWAAYDVPRHLYHFSPAAMLQLLEKAGYRIKACRPMWYDSFYVSLLSSRYKSGKTDWIGAVIAGLRSNARAIADSRRCSSVIYIAGK
jgi:2-polyprenyl-3-methyl-5-hydroxy-6-metoxy-1,4-benzoquinol methylase